MNPTFQCCSNFALNFFILCHEIVLRLNLWWAWRLLRRMGISTLAHLQTEAVRQIEVEQLWASEWLTRSASGSDQFTYQQINADKLVVLVCIAVIIVSCGAMFSIQVSADGHLLLRWEASCSNGRISFCLVCRNQLAPIFSLLPLALADIAVLWSFAVSLPSCVSGVGNLIHVCFWKRSYYCSCK